jgi:hypothetical protein
VAETPDLVAKIQRRIDEHGQYLKALHQSRDVDGYLAACQTFNNEMAQRVTALVGEIKILREDRDHWRDVCAPLTGKEMIDISQGATKLADEEIKQLRAALTEALDLFDATWCPEFGHAPKPEQLARGLELRKLAMS